MLEGDIINHGEGAQEEESCLRSDGLESQDSSGAEASQEALKTANKKPQNLRQNWVISNGAAGSEGGTMTIKLKLNDVPGTNKKRKREPKEEKKKKKKAKTVKKKTRFQVEEKEPPEERSRSREEGGWGTRMPEELLVKIFYTAMRTRTGKSFPLLRSLQNVCCLWQKAAGNEYLWDQVDLSNEPADERMLGELCKQTMSKTRELSVAGWGKKLTMTGIKSISENCRLLSTINLSRCVRISTACVQLLVDSCPHLKHIDLSGISDSPSINSPISFTCLKYLFDKCGQQLTHLILAENTINSFNVIIRSFGEGCPKLEVLDLSNVRLTSDRYLSLEKLQAGCPALRVLRLANSVIGLTPTSLSTQAQSPGFPNLEELSIASCYETTQLTSSLGDSELERLLKTSVKLKLLDVRGCRSVSVSGLIRIPAWDLEHLHLAKCDAISKTDLELVLKKWCHSLQEVDLAWAPHALIINQAVLALSAVEGPSKLKILDVGGSAIGLSAIKILLSKCDHLESLNLQSCRGLPRGIKRLYKGSVELSTLREQMADSKFQEDFQTIDE